MHSITIKLWSNINAVGDNYDKEKKRLLNQVEYMHGKTANKNVNENKISSGKKDNIFEEKIVEHISCKILINKSKTKVYYWKKRSFLLNLT